MYLHLRNRISYIGMKLVASLGFDFSFFEEWGKRLYN